MTLTRNINQKTLVLLVCLGVLVIGGVIWCISSWVALGKTGSRVQRARENLLSAYELSAEYEQLLAESGSRSPLTSAGGEFGMVYHISNLLATGIPDKKITPSPLDEEDPHEYKEGYVEYRYHFTYKNLSFAHAIGIWYLLEADNDPRVKINHIRLEPVPKSDSRGTTYTYTLSLSLSHFSPSKQG